MSRRNFTSKDDRYYPKERISTADRNAAIRQAYERRAESLVEIGRRFGVSGARVCQIARGRTRKNYGTARVVLFDEAPR